MTSHYAKAPSFSAQNRPRGRTGRNLVDDPVARPVQFAIPLKQQEKPVKFPENFRKTIKYEYAVRYLEMMGASPTTENIKMVTQNMPIEKCNVNAAWKSRGWIADMYYITPHPKKQAIDPSARSPSPNDGNNKARFSFSISFSSPSSFISSFVALLSFLPFRFLSLRIPPDPNMGDKNYISSKSTEVRTSEPAEMSAYSAGAEPGSSHQRSLDSRIGAKEVDEKLHKSKQERTDDFELFKKKHIFPYNRRHQLVVQNSAILPSLSLKVPSKALQLEQEDQQNAATIGCMAIRRKKQFLQESQESPGRSPLKVMIANYETNSNGSSTFSSQKMSEDSNFSGPHNRRPGSISSSTEIRDESMLMSEELGRPLEMTVSDITEIQANFVKSLPKDLLHKKLPDDEEQTLTNLLMSPDMKRVTGLVHSTFNFGISPKLYTNIFHF
jgi:hypothetical protein